MGANAQTWSPVGSGITGTSVNTTWSLFAHDSLLYAGGWFNSAGGVSVNDMAQWNGANWTPTGTGTNGYINAMAWYNGNLYAGGFFDTIGGVEANDIAMWNGINWAPVGMGMKSQEYGVYSMAVYNGSLYAGGSFDTVDGKQIFGIARWDGTNWYPLSTGIYAADEDDGVFALLVYNGYLYVAGGIDSAGGVPVSEIAKWDGANWSAVGSYTNGPMYALAEYNGSLYVGGWADTIGGTPANSIAMWNGTSFTPLDSGLYGEPGGSQVNALISYSGELYAGGFFDSVNGQFINCIAKWNGSKWSSVGTGINVGGSIIAMTTFNNALYIGGGFDSAGGTYAKNIAMWTAPDGVKEIEENINISVYPNPASKIISIDISGLSAISDCYIYNELGQQVFAKQLSNSLNGNINVSTYASGVYMIKVISGPKSYSAKFIKL